MRVFELAKKVNLSSKELLAELKKMGIKAPNHMASLEEPQVRHVLEKFQRKPAAATITAPAEKKTRVLIKRKPSELPAEMEEAAKIVPAPASVTAAGGLEAKVISPVAITQETHVQEMQPVTTSPEASVTAPISETRPPREVEVAPSISPPLPNVPPTTASIETEKKLEKRKLLKTDLFELAKQEQIGRAHV